MGVDITKKIDEQGVKIDAIYKSVEKTRKYFLVILWATIICFVLPLIGLFFVVPYFISTYLGGFEGLF
jgi:TRAP-type mannitol/chloroaromatic compound transport system permease small subunit